MQAAKNQHFLPRFLLARFASRETTTEAYTWVFRLTRDRISHPRAPRVFMAICQPMSLA